MSKRSSTPCFGLDYHLFGLSSKQSRRLCPWQTLKKKGVVALRGNSHIIQYDICRFIAIEDATDFTVCNYNFLAYCFPSEQGYIDSRNKVNILDKSSLLYFLLQFITLVQQRNCSSMFNSTCSSSNFIDISVTMS